MFESSFHKLIFCRHYTLVSWKYQGFFVYFTNGWDSSFLFTWKTVFEPASFFVLCIIRSIQWKFVNLLIGLQSSLWNRKWPLLFLLSDPTQQKDRLASFRCALPVKRIGAYRRSAWGYVWPMSFSYCRKVAMSSSGIQTLQRRHWLEPTSKTNQQKKYRERWYQSEFNQREATFKKHLILLQPIKSLRRLWRFRKNGLAHLKVQRKVYKKPTMNGSRVLP